METIYHTMNAYFEFANGDSLPERPKQVFHLACKSLEPIIAQGLPENLSHLIVATTCPDSLSPSLGQMLCEEFNEELGNCHTIDMVQGCAGGVSALILGSQLSISNHSTVLVVQD